MGTRHMVGSPWHIEDYRKKNGGEQRSKSKCMYYRSVNNCKKDGRPCFGVTDCCYYKEILVKNKVDCIYYKSVNKCGKNQGECLGPKNCQYFEERQIVKVENYISVLTKLR